MSTYFSLGPFDAQAPFDGDNIQDDIVAGKYEFPTDVNVSDDAKVCFGCNWPAAQKKWRKCCTHNKQYDQVIEREKRKKHCKAW